MINTVDQKTQEALDAVLKQIDFATLKYADVVADLVSNTRSLAFRLLVGSALLEEIAKRNGDVTLTPEPAPEQAQEESK
jgi:hypothetical protein